MFERILVPLDGSEPAAQALPVAREVAQRFHGSLVLVEVISQMLDWHRSLAPPTDSAGTADIEERAVHAARTQLNRVATTLRGVPVDVDIRLGRPAEAILQAVTDNGCTLICMTAHGYGRLPAAAHDRHHPIHWMLGAISDRIVHTSPVPVLVVRPEQHLEELQKADAWETETTPAITVAATHGPRSDQ